MTLLAIKLIVTPGLVGAASLAGRKWGVAVAGWLVALPLTSAPVALLLALSQGTSFAAAAAAGMLAGTLSQAVYAVGYASLRVPGWVARTGAATAGFVAATMLLQPWHLPVPAIFAIVAAGLVVALWLLPSHPYAQPDRASPGGQRRDLALRMLTATSTVMVISSIAPVIGPYLSGLISPFPVYGAVLAVAAHHQGGSRAAVAVLRGLTWGLFVPAVFFLVLALSLSRVGLAAAFSAATASALATQGVSLAALRIAGGRDRRSPGATG